MRSEPANGKSVRYKRRLGGAHVICKGSVLTSFEETTTPSHQKHQTYQTPISGQGRHKVATVTGRSEGCGREKGTVIDQGRGRQRKRTAERGSPVPACDDKPNGQKRRKKGRKQRRRKEPSTAATEEPKNGPGATRVRPMLMENKKMYSHLWHAGGYLARRSGHYFLAANPTKSSGPRGTHSCSRCTVSCKTHI